MPDPRHALLVLLLALPAVSALADEPGSEADDDAPEVRLVPDEPATSRHEATIAGQSIPYTATAGTMPLFEEDGTVKANLFFVAYTRDDAEGDPDPARPVTFTFNGGPGSSSVWLHLGAFGPRRVVMADDGSPVGPPYALTDNEASILDLTDLVFIDPVTTGFSRAVPGEDDGQFHGVDEDVEAVGAFIRLWCTRNGRWGSPKFLAGESYGTTRAAALSAYLQGRQGMFLNGVILVSSILDFQTARFARGNDLPYVLFLPTYTATAWHHGALAPDLQQGSLRAALDESEAFARGPYASALLRGDALPDGERRAVGRQLARLTGLSETFVERARLRVSIWRFVKELLRDRSRTVGRLDSRFLGIDVDDAGERYEYDPSYAAIQGSFTAMLNHYVRDELGYESDLTYEILTGRVHPWKFPAENEYLNVAESLREAMTQNPVLRVFVASGYYDLATPYFATDHTIAHLGLDPTLRDHVTVEYYEAGHMMYIDAEERAQLRRDLEGFYRGR